MKSIDKLYQFLEDQFGSERFGFHSYGYTQGMAIAKLIEEKIERDYMRLPVDANNEPIRVGDSVAEEPFRPNIGEKPAEVVCMLINSDGWSIGDRDPRGHWFHPATLEHVKPRTLEDVLNEFGIAAARELNADPDGYGISDETIAKCVSEIRELLSGEGGGDD